MGSAAADPRRAGRFFARAAHAHLSPSDNERAERKDTTDMSTDKKTAPALEREDLLELQLIMEREQRVGFQLAGIELQRRMVTSEQQAIAAAKDQLSARLREEYAVIDGDSVDSVSGAVTRKPRLASVPPEEPPPRVEEKSDAKARGPRA